jgi:hypothetical protein
LPDAVRGKMEAALGADFSNVRVHVGPQADRIGAIAFTLGSDIYFAPGRYQPDTVHGQQLLGHELAHVVQQRQGRVRNPMGSGVAVVQDGALEAEADRLGQIAAAHVAVAGIQKTRYASSAFSHTGVQAFAPVQRHRAPIQRVVTSVQLEVIRIEAASLLRTAIGKPKTGGASEFEKYINAAYRRGRIDEVNYKNATDLLKMAWALSQVSADIIGYTKGKTLEDGVTILNKLMVVVRDSIGVDRQPWGGGNHEAYVKDPNYFISMLALPIEFLNQKFAGMSEATKMNMVKSIRGWNHQKGTGQLAEDLFSTDYTPVVRANVAVSLEQLQSQYVDYKTYDPITWRPDVNEVLLDTKQEAWRVVNDLGNGSYTLEPCEGNG